MKTKRNTKNQYLQIRISPQKKAVIQMRAKKARMGMSQWILSRVVPEGQTQFQDLLKSLKLQDNKSYVLAEINDFFQNLSTNEFEQCVAQPPLIRLSPYWENYIAAMVEYAANQKGIQAPIWTQDIKPLTNPTFGSDLMSLRLHLLIHSPPCFRCRNIFIDSSIGDRI